jgi:hypothetical protein
VDSDDKDILKESDRLGVLKRFLKTDKVCERFLAAQAVAGGKINIVSLLKNLGFSDVAIESYKSTISEWLDSSSVLNDKFYSEYERMLNELRKDRETYKVMKKDAAVLESIPVHRSFDLKNTFECIADNDNIRYYLPEGYKIDTLNYEKPYLQIVKLICVSESLPVPFTYMHEYSCSKCDETRKVMDEKEKPRCKECGTIMKKDTTATKSMTAFVSKVIYEGNQIDAISRIKLPMNQFDAAVIPVKNEDKYNLFILAVGMPAPKEVPLVWTGGDRMVDLIRNIDKIHTERLGKCVRGLDHVKMSIIMTRMAGLMGNTSTQALIVGAPGCGKSTVTKFYSFTLTDKSAFRDATAVTHAGLLGSSEVIDVFGSRSPVMQLGLLERYEMAVLDEFLDKSNEDLNVLKNALSSSTITSEKHNNKREVSRMAVLLCPSNVPSAHMKQIRFLATNKMDTFDDRTFSLRAMPIQLKEEFWSLNKGWRDGEDLAILDRFAFIFYIESAKRDIGVIDEIVRSPEDRIPDTVLRSLFYVKTIDDYLRDCVKLKFEYSEDFDRPNLDRLIKKYCLPKSSSSEGFGDDIHSLERLNKYFRMMVECHVLVNMRTHSDESDYAWLDKFYSKLVNFVYTDDLFWEDTKRADTMIRTDEDQQKRGAIRFHIIDYLTQCGKVGAKREDVIGSCSLNGLNTELAISVLSEMVGDNIIIFDPPNVYKIITDK